MSEIHQCTCAICQSEVDAPEQQIHHQINLLMSRLDEQQRRWYAALEAKRYGHGGLQLVSQITGLDEKTIRGGERNSKVTWHFVHRTAYACQEQAVR